ncbi:hypothetical protein BJ165DRAFT_1523275 [Panaeolus papilionaceus]|nr:hypothetical protein BJ165DRAFT_1523275 [Panaeolus papilionaceus]
MSYSSLNLLGPARAVNVKLKTLLEKELLGNDKTLNKFILQFKNFGDPPQSFEESATRLCREIDLVAPTILESAERDETIQNHGQKLPSLLEPRQSPNSAPTRRTAGNFQDQLGLL